MIHQKELPEQSVFTRPNQLSFAISALLAVPAAAVAQDQDSNEESSGSPLEEVLVTATKTTEVSMQDLPQSIQALSEEMIRDSGFQDINDYVRFVPSMSYQQSNPGTSFVVFRGIADASNAFIAEPSAAVYLDEQSLVTNAQPDPRLVDIERVEALSGPQGTLYGGSAQAGTLRIITNKPDPSQWEANVDLMLRGMSEGDSSYDASAVLNIPLSDTAAIRLVGFSARDGGFIDNVTGTTPRFGLKSNVGQEKEDFNEVNINGGRVSARFFPNDDWTVTAGVIYQKTESDGRPEQDPTVGELQVVRFRPDHEFDDQDWTQYALTVEGDLGFANFVSATSYFERDWTYHQDTTVYASAFGVYCYGGHYDANGYWVYYVGGYSRYCFQPAGVGNYYNEPIGYLENAQNNKKFSQEFRLSASGEKADWVVGAFYEKAKERWDFTTWVDGYANSQAADNWTSGRLAWTGFDTPASVNSDVWWFSADRTEWETKAVFGEVTFHVSDKVDATVGGRWFERSMDKIYWVNQPDVPNARRTDGTRGTGVIDVTADDDDFFPKFSLKYQVNDDVMIYGLYSEGFRPGGTNRARGTPFFPAQFGADILENIEFGLKSTLADGRVRLNATYYDMSWDNFQLEVVDPSNVPCGLDTALPEPHCGQPWQKVVANVGNASSSGLELSIDAAASENVTVGFAASWLDAKLDEDVPLEPGFSVPKGSRLALSPEFKAAAYLNYEQDVSWMNGNAESAFFRLQYSHTGDMFNQVEPTGGSSPQILQASYDIMDVSVGVRGSDWSLALFVDNLTDERAILFDNPYEFDRFFGRARQTVNRPREVGIRFSKSFTR